MWVTRKWTSSDKGISHVRLAFTLRKIEASLLTVRQTSYEMANMIQTKHNLFIQFNKNEIRCPFTNLTNDLSVITCIFDSLEFFICTYLLITKSYSVGTALNTQVVYQRLEYIVSLFWWLERRNFF